MLLRKYVQRCIRAVSKQAFILYIYLYAISYQYVPPPVTILCKTYYINYKVKVLEFLFLQHVGFMQILSPSSYLTFLLPLLEIQIHRPQITFSKIRFAANFSYLRNRGRKSNVVLEKETKTCWYFLCVLKEQKSLKSCQQLFSRKQFFGVVVAVLFSFHMPFRSKQQRGSMAEKEQPQSFRHCNIATVYGKRRNGYLRSFCQGCCYCYSSFGDCLTSRVFSTHVFDGRR